MSRKRFFQLVADTQNLDVQALTNPRGGLLYEFSYKWVDCFGNIYSLTYLAAGLGQAIIWCDGFGAGQCPPK